MASKRFWNVRDTRDCYSQRPWRIKDRWTGRYVGEPVRHRGEARIKCAGLNKVEEGR